MRVIFKLQIHGCVAAASSEDVILRREFDFPFVPVPGISYYDNEGNWEAIPEEISYNVEDETFVCWIEDKEIYNAILKSQSHRSIEEIVKEYTDVGWYREE